MKEHIRLLIRGAKSTGNIVQEHVNHNHKRTRAYRVGALVKNVMSICVRTLSMTSKSDTRTLYKTLSERVRAKSFLPDS